MRRDYLVFQQSIECERLLVIGRIQADFVAHYRKFAGFIQRDVEQLRFDLAVVEQANRLFSMVPRDNLEISVPNYADPNRVILSERLNGSAETLDVIFVQPKTRLKQLVCAQQLQRQHDDIFIDALEAVGSRAGSGRRQRCRTRLRCRWRMVRSRGFRRHSSRRGGNGFEFLGVLSNVPASVGTRGARERPTKVSTAAYVGVVSQYIKMFRDLGRPLLGRRRASS